MPLERRALSQALVYCGHLMEMNGAKSLESLLRTGVTLLQQSLGPSMGLRHNDSCGDKGTNSDCSCKLVTVVYSIST